MIIYLDLYIYIQYMILKVSGTGFMIQNRLHFFHPKVFSSKWSNFLRCKGEMTLLRVIPTMAFNSSHLTVCLANLLALYLHFYLTFYLTFHLACLLGFYLAIISSDILSGITICHSTWYVFCYSIWHIS